ncbi:GNAT family N-acetyltransferase [Candidatus Woesearchaeota archaeon]|nr:GNAT family N-acetyltransferase [Candidatus Woesearchaeota archaeon]MBW3022278.1 GNAT family N-acetyltransferase [Candidatus Woesearchaeota archaeon]
MIIRNASLEDIPGIKKIDRFGDMLAKFGPLDRLDSSYKKPKQKKGYFEEHITGKRKWVLVAEEDGKIVGFQVFSVKKREPFYKVKEVGYLDLMFIEKKYRGRGISRMLIDEACRTLKKAGVKYCELSVHSDNPAKDIWKKFGYKDYVIKMWKKL